MKAKQISDRDEYEAVHSSDRLQPFNLSAPLISETLFNLKQQCEDQIIQKEARIGSSSTLGSSGRRRNKRESVAGGSRTIGSQGAQHVQLFENWVFVKPSQAE